VTVEMDHSNADPRALKLQRLRSGELPRVLDLFSGCGGLSLGFSTAGCRIVAAVELDPTAASTHALNLNTTVQVLSRDNRVAGCDIRRTSPAKLVRELGTGISPDAAFDIIIGGPPCQAYARIGRAKLREVASHPKAFLADPRANLWLDFVEYIRDLKPLAILIENVPDALNHGGHNIAEEICEVLEDLHYNPKYTLLNAVHYGVPQMRERMFLIAYWTGADLEVAFPEPIRWCDLPRGYEGTRQVALQTLGCDLFRNPGHFTTPPAPSPDLPAAFTAKDALFDLPPIREHLTGKLRKGMRDLSERVAYVNDASSPVAQLMRDWPSFSTSHDVSAHVIRSLPRDYAIFRVMEPGTEYPRACEIAQELLRLKIAQLEEKGIRIKKGSAAYAQLCKEIVPPYDPGKFPNKWRKMEADSPSRTLLAHLGKDGYSHIHYDSAQARTISVREAARLQTFPDGFEFCGAMNEAFRQIGNAVPPVLSYFLADCMLRAFRRAGATFRRSGSKRFRKLMLAGQVRIATDKVPKGSAIADERFLRNTAEWKSDHNVASRESATKAAERLTKLPQRGRRNQPRTGGK
jgi:DNA (cytosine-5)-methyltransferase 1